MKQVPSIKPIFQTLHKIKVHYLSSDMYKIMEIHEELSQLCEQNKNF